MEEIRKIAMAWFDNLPKEKKEGGQKLFECMDNDGDKKITITEFLRFCEANPQINFHGRSGSWLAELFQNLDKDGNGSLDFAESITAFYLFCCGICCAKCQTILNGKTYITCDQCFHKKPSFDLCHSCHSRGNFTHAHQDGTVPDFKDTASLRSLGKSPSTSGGIALKLLKKAKPAAPTIAIASVHALPDATTNAIVDGLGQMCSFM